MAVVESHDLNGAASKVAIGPPVINDGNIADLGTTKLPGKIPENGSQLYVVLSRIGFFQII